MMRAVAVAVRRGQVLRRWRHTFRDVTDSAFVASSQSAADLVDKAISEVLRDTRDVPQAFEQALEEDPTCALALVMKGLHSSLLLGPSIPRKDMRQILAILEGAASERTLNKREAFMAAALLRTVQGDFATAANLLETVMLDNPDDMVSFKYIQQTYYLLGDSENMLGSAARHSRFFDDGHLLHGHGLGILALGAARGSKFHMAEEFAERSLSLTMKQDPSAKVALAHTMLVNGRTSEGLSHIKQLNDAWWKTDNFWDLSHMQGLLNCQTGRYRASERALDDMITRLRELATPHPRALSLASSLLWTLHMDSQISRTADAVKTSKFFTELAELWAPLVGSEMHSFVYVHLLMCVAGNPDVATLALDHESASMLVQPAQVDGAEADVAYNALESVVPELKFASFSAREHTRAVLGLQQAILDISTSRSSEAANTLLGIQHALHHVGGASVDHWVWRGMLADSLLLSKRHTEARLLLSEWIARVPTQAQFWSRFAHSLKGCGLTTAGEHAAFTANQLGIGQHGHGAH